MKLIFAGTPAFAVLPLRAIAEAGFEIAAVLTQPDRPQGRKGILTPPPVKTEAERLGLFVLQPERLRDDPSALKSVGADLMVTCAYGQILTQEVLDAFPLGVWNFHASLLPAYRGAAPIPRVILDGCTETGITVMRTELGLDTGDILLARPLKILGTDTAETLGDRLSRLAAELAPDVLAEIAGGRYTLTKQGEGFVCRKVQRTEVDFTRPAREVSACIRGLSPAPGSWANICGAPLNFFYALPVPGTGEAGEILSADPKTGLIVACGEGAVRISDLQPSGGKRMTDTAYLNGRKLAKGMKFDLSRSV